MSGKERKITKIGNSSGITIPNDLLVQAGLKAGDNIHLEVVDGVIQIRKNRKVSLPEGVSEDFFDVLNETVASYDETLKGLKDR